MADEPLVGDGQPKRKPPTERQKARGALSATYIDNWSLVWWDGHIRLTLGEYLYQTYNYRFAAVLEWEHAEELANDLLEMVAKGRAEVKARALAALVEETKQSEETNPTEESNGGS
jgi:hypothetical protein